MAEEPHAYPLVMELMKCSRLPWFWTTAIIAVVLLLFLVLVAHLEGVLTHQFECVEQPG